MLSMTMIYNVNCILFINFIFQVTRTIVEDNIHDVEPAEDALTFTIVELGTQKGNRKLVDSHGYTYKRKGMLI